MNDKIIQTLEFDKIRERLAERCVSDSGRALALKLMPETTLAGSRKAVAETAEAETITIKLTSYPLMSFNDITGELKRLKSGASLSCRELLSVCLLLKASKRAREAIRPAEGSETQYLPDMADGLYSAGTIISRIESSIIGENEVADEASSALALCRRKMRSENDSIRDKLQAMLRNKDTAKYLQDNIVTMRSGRYVIPVKQEYRGQIQGVVHAQSASGSTLFIEPMSVVEANNHLRILEEQERLEIEAVLRSLTELLRPHSQELRMSLETLAYLDLVFAKAGLAIEQKAVKPDFTDGRQIRIINGRHPLIDPEVVIPVSVELPDEVDALIITGPNTGGKTVTLKLIGLFAVMAQAGLFLPAQTGVSIPVFTKIFADIGDEQSIEQSLSTFSSHMRNIVKIMRYADANSLVLIDEIGAGTDPEEGAALGLSILEELHAKGCKLFTTTHYSQIKAFATSAEGFSNACMEFDTESLMPTYHMIMGVAGSSNAMLIAKRLGVSRKVVERAGRYMSAERVEFDKLIREAEKTRSQAAGQLERAYEMQRHAEEIDRRAKELEKELDERRTRELEKAREDALEIVRKARDEAEAVIDELKKTKNKTESQQTRDIEKARKTLDSRKEVMQRSLKLMKKPHRAVAAEELHIGDAVRIVSLEADGTVRELPDSRGMVSVQAGILAVSVHLSDLELRNESGKKAALHTSRVTLAHRAVPLELNLHGYTVEEAVDEIDKYLDDAFLAGLSEVAIVHGKGTGALRRGVQDYLRTHPHVKSYRHGKAGEGDIGVTIVTLK